MDASKCLPLNVKQTAKIMVYNFEVLESFAEVFLKLKWIVNIRKCAQDYTFIQFT
jgi:hypothetical protein